MIKQEPLSYTEQTGHYTQLRTRHGKMKSSKTSESVSARDCWITVLNMILKQEKLHKNIDILNEQVRSEN
jgi:hypothetical protein